MTAEPYDLLPPEPMSEVGACDVCGSTDWQAIRKGRSAQFVCRNCESVYTYDGTLLSVGHTEGMS